MIGWMAVTLALGLMVIAFWQKRLWLCVFDGIAWLLLGAYGFIYRAEGELFLYFGWMGVAGALVMFMSVIWLRPKREPAPLEPSRRQLYEDRLERELDGVRKKDKE